MTVELGRGGGRGEREGRGEGERRGRDRREKERRGKREGGSREEREGERKGSEIWSILTIYLLHCNYNLALH